MQLKQFFSLTFISSFPFVIYKQLVRKEVFPVVSIFRKISFVFHFLEQIHTADWGAIVFGSWVEA